jgi:ABC-2 type transport system permease protein
MNWKRVQAIARKEVYHISRDPFTLALALLLPVIMVTIFGFAIEFNVQRIPISVYDGDHTESSRHLLDTLSSSHYFVPEMVSSPDEAVKQIDADRVKAALIINHSFEYDLLSGRNAHAQVFLDGADNSTIGAVEGYFGVMQTLVSQKITGEKINPPIDLKTRFLYNPELNSRWFVVPGLMVVVVAILSILLTALTVAREYENGSMELLLSTPIRPVEIILGKLTPYIFLGLSAVVFVYLVARFFFEVPFRGSHAVLILGSILFLATYLAQGLLISVTLRRQQLAMQVAMMSGMLPTLLLSGFIFPVESMPKFFRVLTMILPARWFMNIAREVFLKDSSFYVLRYSFLGLSLICTVMILIASKKFKRDLEP